MDRRRISVEDVEPEEVENIARLMSIFPNEKSAASLINRKRGARCSFIKRDVTTSRIRKTDQLTATSGG